MTYSSLTSYNTPDTLYCGLNYDTNCDISISGDNVTCDACLFEEVNTAVDNKMSCDENYESCLISCRGSNACFGRGLYCRPIDYVIGETSGKKCQNCVISCLTDDACKVIQVYTFDCESVQINAFGQNWSISYLV